jgi:hypothetical protein
MPIDRMLAFTAALKNGQPRWRWCRTLARHDAIDSVAVGA